MVQTRESACTTEERRVVAIEQRLGNGPCFTFLARVVDMHGSSTTLEHTLTLSEEALRPLKGAQAALKTFHGGDNKEDEEDDGCCMWIGWFPSYIRSCLTHFLPQERSLTFARAAVAPPTTVPPTATNTNAKLVVLRNEIGPFEPRTLILVISTVIFTVALQHRKLTLHRNSCTRETSKSNTYTEQHYRQPELVFDFITKHSSVC
ncbi:hypothetical protein IQ07DRAFT_382587 [Pyrenochaeta sp. DS3sAY3a]|nr:hypothetical protein IQ07DRAFT_382587 [Pyrenochaeta sp. DS3sAY3a]